MLTSILLRFIARNVDSIVNFVNKLDAELDAFMARHDAEVAAFETEIEQVWEDAEKRVAEIEQSIEDKAKAALIVAGLKKALPTAE